MLIGVILVGVLAGANLYMLLRRVLPMMKAIQTMVAEEVEVWRLTTSQIKASLPHR